MSKETILEVFAGFTLRKNFAMREELDWIVTHLQARLVHPDVEDCSEELLRQLSYAIKNQLGHPKTLLGALERY